MRFFPKVIETRYFEGTSEGLFQHISGFIKTDTKEGAKHFMFQGNYDKEQFSISLILKSPTRYLPQIQGKIFQADNVMRIEVAYEMVMATQKTVLVWTAISAFLTLFFILGYNAWLYGCITGGFTMVNYILAREQFAKQVRKSQRVLDRLFS